MEKEINGKSKCVWCQESFSTSTEKYESMEYISTIPIGKPDFIDRQVIAGTICPDCWDKMQLPSSIRPCLICDGQVDWYLTADQYSQTRKIQMLDEDRNRRVMLRDKDDLTVVQEAFAHEFMCRTCFPKALRAEQRQNAKATAYKTIKPDYSDSAQAREHDQKRMVA